MQYNRILLKLSGESLMGEQKYGIDTRCLESYARQIHEIAEMGIQIGIVIGGGNIFRGLSGTNKGFDRVKGDSMGMLATVINSLALSSALDNEGCKNKVLTAIRHGTYRGILLESQSHGIFKIRTRNDYQRGYRKSLLHDRHCQ